MKIISNDPLSQLRSRYEQNEAYNKSQYQSVKLKGRNVTVTKTVVFTKDLSPMERASAGIKACAAVVFTGGLGLLSKKVKENWEQAREGIKMVAFEETVPPETKKTRAISSHILPYHSDSTTSSSFDSSDTDSISSDSESSESELETPIESTEEKSSASEQTKIESSKEEIPTMIEVLKNSMPEIIKKGNVKAFEMLYRQAIHSEENEKQFISFLWEMNNSDIQFLTTILQNADPNLLLDLAGKLIEKEVQIAALKADKTEAIGSLLRSEFLSSKLATIIQKRELQPAIEHSHFKKMSSIVAKGGAHEVNPMLLKDQSRLKKNQQTLIDKTQLILTDLEKTMQNPKLLRPEVKRFYKNVYNSIANSFGKDIANQQLRSLFFLRLYNPMFISVREEKDHGLALRDGMLISKIIQNISNEVTGSSKEPFMDFSLVLTDKYLKSFDDFLQNLME